MGYFQWVYRVEFVSILNVFAYLNTVWVRHRDCSLRIFLLKRRVNVEIEAGKDGATKWYLGMIKSIKDGICTISFDGFDSSHNIEVPENEIPSEDIIVL